MRYRDTRKRIHVMFEVGAGGQWGRGIDYAIVLLIVANVVAVALETVGPLFATYRTAFLSFETVSVAVFTAEYAARLWAATEHPNYRHPVWGRLRYAVSPYMLIDLLAILPFFLGALVDLRFLRALRLVRFLRLLKLARYSESVQLFATAFRLKRDELVMTSIVGTILLLVASSLMYFAEHAAQPEEFSSIPASLWWGVITLTTVGYGDVSPETAAGRTLGAAVAVIGVGIFALPASLLAAGFVEAAREETITCPHCGEDILQADVEEAMD